MTSLIEQRNQYNAKLDSLRTSRQRSIDEAVEAYRMDLERSERAEDKDIADIQRILKAFDEIIAYENGSAMPTQPEAQPAQTVEAVHYAFAARPGMPTVDNPRG